MRNFCRAPTLICSSSALICFKSQHSNDLQISLVLSLDQFTRVSRQVRKVEKQSDKELSSDLRLNWSSKRKQKKAIILNYLEKHQLLLVHLRRDIDAGFVCFMDCWQMFIDKSES